MNRIVVLLQKNYNNRRQLNYSDVYFNIDDLCIKINIVLHDNVAKVFKYYAITIIIIIINIQDFPPTL